MEDLLSTGPTPSIFQASALWADAFYKSTCPSVRVSVCLFVHSCGSCMPGMCSTGELVHSSINSESQKRGVVLDCIHGLSMRWRCLTSGPVHSSTDS